MKFETIGTTNPVSERVDLDFLAQSEFAKTGNASMLLRSVVLFLAALLLSGFPGNGQDSDFAGLSTTQPEVQMKIVDTHNRLRRAVLPSSSNMVKMVWDNAAQVNAQAWANACNYQHSDQEKRKTTVTCGENLFMSSVPISWEKVIQNWYDERNNFEFGKGPTYSNAVVGHYTQVVWATSSSVACGFSYCSNQAKLKYYYVCQYCPAGNYVNTKNTPYLPGIPCASCPNYCDNGLCTNGCIHKDDYTNCKILKNMVSCQHDLVRQNCKASCNCEDKIH
ncbi:PREDICTED: cysteine-rich secretory protein 3 [Chrysochloris asiatica]|uniref:Cysteine-rich secretory protein 3 n=1 Tax=Chrysochloris asiatica TaxID=185453 RepID=A0A9B0TG28_CHRAS|nr:PREDICTED: cysteine-rich secretory protein 3 [Chrysochloris asiatica]